MPEKWHLLSGGDLVRRLETDTSKGLSLAEEQGGLKSLAPTGLPKKNHLQPYSSSLSNSTTS